MTTNPERRAAAEAWMAEDPDPDTRAELAALLAAGDDAALAERFDGRLQFGTAGLRGEMGAGPNRMNRALVRRAAAGLADWLLQFHPDGIGDGVVICYDARHHSRQFAEDTAGVLAAQAITAHLLAGPLPTPVLAFVVKHLRAAAGVMVTASHNPARDNGYKVYDSSGAQIVPPVDGQVSAAIDAVGSLSSVPVAAPDHPLIDRVGPELVGSYVDAVLAMLPASRAGAPGSGRGLSIVYSAMHGVGGATVTTLLEQAGFGPPTVVSEQFAPDPDFPTVAFPNPEEPGAMDLTLALAAKTGADVAVVNDPDADRLAVAVPAGAANGPWQVLRGDEIGVLLADAVLADPPVPAPGDADLEPLLACSLVSSQQLGRMAAAAGVAFEETLTGFKWIARSPGPDRRLLFGYEEALGYSVGGLVGDKDGVSALLAVVQRVAALRAQGTTLLARLDDLSRQHGLHVTRQLSFRADGLVGQQQIAATMARLRADPPAAVDGRAVDRLDDLATPAPGSRLPPADVLVFHLRSRADGRGDPMGSGSHSAEPDAPSPSGPDLSASAPQGRADGRGDPTGSDWHPAEPDAPSQSGPDRSAPVTREARLIVRPSGTEPKLKCYLEVVRAVAPDADGLADARADAEAELEKLAQAVTALLALD